jgi:SAM-dependent methyltransferase
MLDLGCGSGLHRELGERAGFHWVGLDYDNPNAPILGDAHALPFEDQSFELVLSLAVLEHIQFPLVMAREVARVLKPGGLFIGTVAFLEPFHGNSFYHHTHLATFNTLRCGGLEVLKIGPNRDWNVLKAHVRMGSGLFPKMPRMLGSALVGPLQILHRLWWWAGSLVTPKSNREARLLGTTGAFEFVARRSG